MGMMQGRIRFVAVLVSMVLLPMIPGVSHALVLRPEPGIFKPDAAPPGNTGNPADVVTLIERAKESIANNRPTLKNDIDNLFLTLLRSGDADDHNHLIAAIGEIGDFRHGTSPARVKNYVRQVALIVFSELPKDDQLAATTVWSRLFPSRKMMERKIGIVPLATPADKEDGLKVLRARGVDVSYDTLKTALSTGDPQMTEALLQAGLNVENDNIDKTFEMVWFSLQTACRNPTIPADWINAAIDRLVEYGYPIDYVDHYQSTLLMQLAPDCSGAVVAHIADLGTVLDFRDPLGATALEIALKSDAFEAADVLMERGARLTPAAAKRVLLSKRQDLRRPDYVKRATEAE